MFDELKTFITVVEYKNFTKAGEILHLSQPSVSAHVKNLESRFQTTLIHRSVKQKTIVITESGQKLYRYAKEILDLTDLAYEEVSNNHHVHKGHIRVGASLTIGEYILPAFLGEFVKKYPNIEVEVCINNTSIISEQVKSLTLDIGLIEGANVSAYFNQEYFSEDQLVLALPYHEDFDPKHFYFELLNNKTWIVRETGSGTREYVDLFLSSHEIIPKQIMVMGSNYAIVQAVSNGLGVTIMSHVITNLPEAQGKINTIPLNANFNRHFSYILPKAISPSSNVEHFITELKNYAAHMAL